MWNTLLLLNCLLVKDLSDKIRILNFFHQSSEKYQNRIQTPTECTWFVFPVVMHVL